MTVKSPPKVPQQSSRNKPKRTTKKRRKNINPVIKGVDPFMLARVFIQENECLLPQALINGLLGAFRSKDLVTVRKLVDTYGSPQLYESPTSYYTVAQLFALIQKVPFPFGGGDKERESRAYQKFLDSERRCRIATRRLQWYGAHPNREDETMRVILAGARNLVDRVLGDVDDFGFSIIDGWKFGPGMTSCSPTRDCTTPFYKLTQEERQVTSRCYPYASLAVNRCPQWAAWIGDVCLSNRMVMVDWNVVRSCKLTFVPKDERTFRTIAIEPFGNVMVQLGVHKHIKERLERIAGIRIEDQTKNQEAALLGSLTWESNDTLSTIDLSSASDCVSVGLVERLVRPQMRALLEDLRCEYYTYNDIEYPLSKWSSMGNGYTFALETLLFWALAQSCENYCNTGNKALAYGDDIVASKCASLLVIQTLRYCGFRVNTSKTFVNGPFRESCGKDFYDGTNVRPVFVKSYALTATNCFSLLNQLDVEAGFSTDRLFKSVVTLIPPDVVRWGPHSDSVDTHLHAPWYWLHRNKPQGWRWDVPTQQQVHHKIVFKTKIFGGFEAGKYVTWLYNTQNREILGEDDTSVQITRRSRGFYRVRSAPANVRSMAVRDYFFLTKG